MSEPGVDRFTLQGEHAEDALVDPVKGLAPREPLEGLDAEGELASGEGSLATESSRAESFEIRRGRVLGTVDASG